MLKMEHIHVCQLIALIFGIAMLTLSALLAWAAIYPIAIPILIAFGSVGWLTAFYIPIRVERLSNRKRM